MAKKSGKTARRATPNDTVRVGVLSSVDFGRRLNSSLATLNQVQVCFTGTLAEGWRLVLAHRPRTLIIEIGPHYDERTHRWLREFLEQVRDRLKDETSIVIVLRSSDKFYYGGDLLFESEDSLKPSGFVDTFIAPPPPAIPSVASLPEQLANVITLVRDDDRRRARGKASLPPLGSPGWVQSLADPTSRELWCRWLPRYASYTNENPIIIGETGTGKTNLAYALHLLSERPGQFVSITPRDFSSSELVQAELFGAVAGAYTGAVDKWGLVKSAEQGTLFIDELQSIDKDLQGKLITFIENKAYRRVGSAETIAADVRFVFASNRSLSDMMHSDVLRHDFAYRLERVQLELPPLHARPLDIAAALGYSLAKIHRQRPQAVRIEGFSPQAFRMLFSYKWPGNLRQLENAVARLCERADIYELDTIDEALVSQVFEDRLALHAVTSTEVVANATAQLSDLVWKEQIGSLDQGLNRLEEVIRSAALEATGGDTAAAAELIDDQEESLVWFSKGHAVRSILEQGS